MGTVEKRSTAVRLKVGDIICIPLTDGRYAYGQYTGTHENYPNSIGLHMAIFKEIYTIPIAITDINMSELLYPLLFVQIKGGLKYAGWRIIGRLPVPNYELPEYRDTNAFMNGARGKLDGWSIRSIHGSRYVGYLDESARDLEFYISWGYNGLDHRLVNGHFWTDDIW